MAARPGRVFKRSDDRRALPARRSVPHLGGLQRLLPHDLGRALHDAMDGAAVTAATREAPWAEKRGGRRRRHRAASRADRLMRVARRSRASLVLLARIGSGSSTADSSTNGAALHPARARCASRRPRSTTGRCCSRRSLGHAEDHLRRRWRLRCSAASRSPMLLGAVRMDRAGALSLCGDPAGDADHRHRAAASSSTPRPRSGAADLRLPRRLLPDPVQHDAGPEVRPTAICSTCSSSTAPAAGRRCSISKLPARSALFPRRPQDRRRPRR